MAESVRELPPPVLLAALVCDMVIVDQMTGKVTVVGIFDLISASDYPARHDSLYVYCQLTNGRGRVTVRIRIVDLDKEDEGPIHEGTVVGEFVDVRQVANVVYRVGGLTFPHPGEYRVQVFAGTEFLGERRILCKLVPLSPVKPGDIQ